MGTACTAGFVKNHTHDCMGTVSMGTGMVWEIPTCGIPVPNPNGAGPSVRMVRTGQQSVVDQSSSVKSQSCPDLEILGLVVVLVLSKLAKQKKQTGLDF